MATYCLLFRGLLPDQAPESFALAMSELHRLTPQQAGMVLTGQGLVLARGLTRKRALELQSRLFSNGCVCALEEEMTQLMERAEREARRRSSLMQYGVVVLLVVGITLALCALGGIPA